MEKSKKTLGYAACFPLLLRKTCKEKSNGRTEGFKTHCRVGEPIMSHLKTYLEDELASKMETVEEAQAIHSINNEFPVEPLQFLSRSWNVSSVEFYQSLSRPNVVDCTDPTTEVNNGDPDVDSLAMKPHSASQPIHEALSVGRRKNKKWLFTRHMSCLLTLIQAESVRKWIKNVKEKRKEENRVKTAEIQAAMSVAGVAAAVAAFASANKKSKGEIALASAAALVAAQCVEVAAMMGANHRQISSAIDSAVCVKTAGDIQTLTAAAATALRGVETFKSKTRRGKSHGSMVACDHERENARVYNVLPPNERNISSTSSRDILVKGTLLLTRVKNGNPKWKVVSIYLNKKSQVTLKLKTKKLGGYFNTCKESQVLELLESVEASSWEKRGSGDHVYYFGLNTSNGVIEFEFKDKFIHQIWILGISQLLKFHII